MGGDGVCRQRASVCPRLSGGQHTGNTLHSISFPILSNVSDPDPDLIRSVDPDPDQGGQK